MSICCFGALLTLLSFRYVGIRVWPRTPPKASELGILRTRIFLNLRPTFSNSGDPPPPHRMVEVSSQNFIPFPITTQCVHTIYYQNSHKFFPNRTCAIDFVRRVLNRRMGNSTCPPIDDTSASCPDTERRRHNARTNLHNKYKKTHLSYDERIR